MKSLAQTHRTVFFPPLYSFRNCLVDLQPFTIHLREVEHFLVNKHHTMMRN